MRTIIYAVLVVSIMSPYVYGIEYRSTHGSLLEIPSGIPLETTHLQLFHNKITTLIQLGQYVSNLVLLDLSYTSINAINRRFFANRTNLTEVMLDHNALTEVSNLTLFGLVRLLKMDISFNRVTYIADDALM